MSCNVKLLDFQDEAVFDLQEKFAFLWNKDEQTELLLKAPTGSGKTLITTYFIDSLQRPGEFMPPLEKACFIWITKGDELTMQSKHKFEEYFRPNVQNTLSTFETCGCELKENEVLFVNWEKLTQTKGLDRLKRRRPDDPEKYKESGFYFEDLMENTHNAGLKVVLVVDESHSNVGTENSKVLIDLMNPKMILKISATPFKSESEEDSFYRRIAKDDIARIVEIKHKDVVDAGLIKEEIESQTLEELERTNGTDANIDEVMLDLAIERRNQIKMEWLKLGININPLVLIQLPNDDSRIDESVETKEIFTMKYLKKRGIKETNIAVWLEDKKKKAEWRLEDNDSEIDFLLFKLACGTGWDCPRAHILVMFREIKSPVFHTQTLGRIIRMPIPDKKLLSDSPMLRIGYLYTTYARNQVGASIISGTANKPKVFTSQMPQSIKTELVKEETTRGLFDFFSNIPVVSKKDNAGEKEKPNFAAILSKPTEEMRKEVLSENVAEKVEIPEKNKETFQTNLEKLIEDNIDNLQDEDYGKLGIINETNETEQQKTLNSLYLPTGKKVEHITALVYHDAIKIFEETTSYLFPIEKKTRLREYIQTQFETAGGLRDAEIILDECLKSEFVSRTDYGDLGLKNKFQKSFFQSMHNYFGTHDKSLFSKDDRDAFRQLGVSLDGSYKIKVMVDTHFTTEETYNDDDDKTSEQEMSKNDVSVKFTVACQELLRDNKIGNIARSFSVLKEALRQWFNQIDLESTTLDFDKWMRVFLTDYDKEGSSVFRMAIARSLSDYEPTRKLSLQERAEEAKNAENPFRIRTKMNYDESHEVFSHSRKSFQQPFYLPKEYKGRENEIRFIEFLENDPNVDRWFRNPQTEDKTSFSIKYFDSVEKRNRLFLPDWIVRYKNGDIGIFDTKAGFTKTANSVETQDKLKALMAKIEQYNRETKKQKRYIGGMYEQQKNSEWKLINSLSNQMR